MAVEFWVLIFVFGLGGRAGREGKGEKRKKRQKLTPRSL